MEVKRVKCPQCGVILEVKNSKNEAVKSFSCPGCHASLSVTFQKQEVDDSITRLPTRQVEHASLPMLISNGQAFQLSLGRNIIGRKATTSVADIQIPTEDRLISRHHALIMVEEDPAGGYRVRLTNYKNKNLTRVNGVDVVDDDEIFLEEGATLLMGATVLTFTSKPFQHV